MFKQILKFFHQKKSSKPSPIAHTKKLSPQLKASLAKNETYYKVVTSANLLIGLLILVSLAYNFSFRKADLSEDYKIVYEAYSGLSQYIAVMKADGSDPLSLTRTFGLAQNGNPVWSPDGTRIAFIHDRNIYVMKANGSDQTPLTDGPAGSGGMVWSPDSRQMVFTSLRDNGIKQIFVMNADGSNVRQLTHDQHYICCPVWSPDGTRLAFGYDWELVVMDRDGSNMQQLTYLEDGSSKGPAWSPDGTTIAFTTQVRASDRQLWYQIFVIKPDGTGLKQLTTEPVHHGFPFWSPDSSRIAFELSTKNAGETDLYLMNADGSQLIQLTDNPGWDIQPTWSPDGRQIAYAAEQGVGHWDIYVMKADGSDKTRLTTNPAYNGNPHWR